MAATARLNRELKAKMAQTKKTTKDPVEMLRACCLERGASGIKGLGRYTGLDVSISNTLNMIYADCILIKHNKSNCIVLN